jgi:hypothetical protein
MENEIAPEVLIELNGFLYSDAQDLIDGLEALDGLSVDVRYRTQDGGLTESRYFRDFIAHYKILVHYLPQAVPTALAAAKLYEIVSKHVRTWRASRESKEPEPPILFDEHNRRIKLERQKRK